MVSMLNELNEGNILKLTFIVRFACVTLDVGHPISENLVSKQVLSMYIKFKSDVLSLMVP
jgi:hypothetical protein